MPLLFAGLPTRAIPIGMKKIPEMSLPVTPLLLHPASLWRSVFSVHNEISMPTNKLTPEIIIAAIEGFESQKARIDAQIAELRAMLRWPHRDSATPEAPTGKRRKISAAARKRMKEGQQRRWAKIRGETEPPSSPVTPEPSNPNASSVPLAKANIGRHEEKMGGEAGGSGEGSTSRR